MQPGFIRLWITCGFLSWERLDEIRPWVDLFLFDCKATGSEKHRQLTGVGDELILNNLIRLNKAGAAIWLRCPLVPGINDDLKHLDHIAELAETLPGIQQITLEPYHPLGLKKAEEFGMESRLNRNEFTPATTIRFWKTRIAAQTAKQVTVA